MVRRRQQLALPAPALRFRATDAHWRGQLWRAAAATGPGGPFRATDAHWRGQLWRATAATGRRRPVPCHTCTLEGATVAHNRRPPPPSAAAARAVSEIHT